MSIRFRFIPLALSLVFSIGFAGALQAQELPPGVALGMTPDALQAALPTIERVARPVRIPGGAAGTLVGSWRGQPVQIAGLPFEPTFYFAGSRLRRVEWAAEPTGQGDRGAAAYAELLDWGRQRFGTAMASRDPGSELASWVADDADVYAQRIDDPRRAPSVRLVYKQRQLKEASQL